MHDSLWWPEHPPHAGVPVDVTRWPHAVRSAELVRGTLVRCGPGLRFAAWPETAAVRAEAIRQELDDKQMPVLLAAAWVWGCARHPGTPFACSTQRGTRPKLRSQPQLTVHEFRYPDTDLVRCGPLTLPTPARTACDLVRLTDALEVTVVVAIRLLLRKAGLSRVEWEHTLRHGPGRHRKRAMQRVALISS